MFVEDFSTPETEVEAAKPKVYSLDGLAAWLEKQPLDRSYDYDCNGACLLAQYFCAQGMGPVIMGATFFYHGPNQKTQRMPSRFDAVAHDGPHTYGAALDRALSLAALQGKG